MQEIMASGSLFWSRAYRSAAALRGGAPPWDTAQRTGKPAAGAADMPDDVRDAQLLLDKFFGTQHDPLLDIDQIGNPNKPFPFSFTDDPSMPDNVGDPLAPSPLSSESTANTQLHGRPDPRGECHLHATHELMSSSEPMSSTEAAGGGTPGCAEVASSSAQAGVHLTHVNAAGRATMVDVGQVRHSVEPERGCFS